MVEIPLYILASSAKRFITAVTTSGKSRDTTRDPN